MGNTVAAAKAATGNRTGKREGTRHFARDHLYTTSMTIAASQQGKAKPPVTLSIVAGFAVLYGLVHSVARLGASHNLGEQEPLENIYAQTLASGYSPNQLPLYDWLIWGLQQLLPPDVTSFLLLKYSLLVALACFMFIVARRVTGSALWALIAVESMALIYQIFWRLHETHTHLIGAMVFSLAATWALIRCVDRQHIRDYAILGCIIGLGCLTQLTFSIFVLAMAGACLVQPSLRQRLATGKLLVTLPLTLLIISPHALWLLQSPERLAAFGESMHPSAWAGIGAPPLEALWKSIETPILALSPYIIFLFALFPRTFGALIRRLRANHETDREPDWTRLILHAVMLEWAGFIIISVAFGLQRYSVQDLLPLFLVLPIALADLARQTAPPAQASQRFMKLALVISLIALLVRLAHMYVHEPVCRICRWGEPYAALAENMQTAGFRQGTILTSDAALGGNLRAHFPDSHVILEKAAKPSPVPDCPTARCVRTNPGAPPSNAAGESGIINVVKVPWSHLWKPRGYRESSWWFVLSPAPSTDNSTDQ